MQREVGKDLHSWEVAGRGRARVAIEWTAEVEIWCSRRERKQEERWA